MNLDGTSKNISKPSSVSDGKLPAKSALKKSDSKEKQISHVAQEVLKKNISFSKLADFRSTYGREIELGENTKYYPETVVDQKVNMPSPRKNAIAEDEYLYIKNRVQELEDNKLDGEFLSHRDTDFLKEGKLFLAKPREQITEIPPILKKENQEIPDRVVLPNIGRSKIGPQAFALADDLKNELKQLLSLSFEKLDAENKLFPNRQIVSEYMFKNQPKKEEPITESDLHEIYHDLFSYNSSNPKLPQKDGQIDIDLITTLVSDHLKGMVDLQQMIVKYPIYSKEMIDNFLRTVPLEESIVKFMQDKRNRNKS